jgi:hypothetical protein
MSKLRVVLSMNGGLIQDAFSTDATIELIVVDWDTEDSDTELDELVEVADEHGGSNRAFVGMQPIRPFDQLAGTDTQAALNRAGLTYDSG